MEYIKFNASDKETRAIYCYYRNYDGEDKNILRLVIPLDKFLIAEPDFKMLNDTVCIIYLEEPQNIYQKIHIDGRLESLSNEEKSECIRIVKDALLNHKYDELLKPPSIDEQVESFMKEFFQDTPTSNEDKNDLLKEFFEQIENQTTIKE